MEKVLTDDLDNNLITNEVYSGIVNLSKPPLTQNIQQPSDVSPNLSEPSPTRINPFVQPTPNLTVEPINSGDTDDGMSTEPVDLEKFPQGDLPSGDDGYVGGGSLGGGGGMPPMEEEGGGEMMRTEDECKILNMDCKLFYGLLVVLALGGYIYYRNNKSVKAK